MNYFQAIAVREAKRKNPTYRPYALVALGGVAQARKDLDLMPDAISIVSQVVGELEDEEDSMDIDSGNGQKSKYVWSAPALTVSYLLTCTKANHR